MNSKGKDWGRLRPSRGRRSAARSERPGALGPLTCNVGRAAPPSSAGCSPWGCVSRSRHPRITAARFFPALSPFNSVAQFGAAESGFWGGWEGGGRFVVMGICRSKWGTRTGIWAGQWGAGGGGAPRSSHRQAPGVTEERALVGGPAPAGSLSPSLRGRP